MSMKQLVATGVPILCSSAMAFTKVGVLEGAWLLGLTLVCYVATGVVLSSTRESVMKRNITGKDINKKGTPQGEKLIPESQGLAPSCAHLLVLFLLPLYLLNKGCESYSLVFAASYIVLFNLFIGFYDDVLEIRWRHKAFLSILCAIPAALLYQGDTSLRVSFLPVLQLGILYRLGIALMSTFVPNAINIYAGINGLEVGQSIIICSAQVVYASLNYANDPHGHLLALMVLLPALWAMLVLFRVNRYPSQCFVGDTFCFWAGGAMVAASVLNGSTVNLGLLIAPQIFNFLYSLPQLFGFVHCPRHRLPEYLVEQRVLKGRQINMNLLNLFLRVKGPTSEEDTCVWLVLLQLVVALGVLVFL